MQYGLIGEKLGHSYSPEIHAQVADYKYELKEIARENLDEFLKLKDFKGINVTIPYKQDVIPYLDEISDRAKSIGAVNTIVNKDGVLWGDNTDFQGMASLIRHLGIDLKGKKVLILGTGGTSKTALAVARSLGAGSVLKVSRKESNETITYEEAVRIHNDARVIINTTPSGMFPAVEGRPVDISAFKDLEGVIDVVYNPLRTNLVLDAQERNIPAEGGLYMLSAQGVYASCDFTGTPVSDAQTEKAYKNVLNSKRSIVLIGMPSCGKTTIGNALGEKLKREVVDTDSKVVDRIGMEIAQYFEKYGEKEFRDRESEAIEEISHESGLIIATGGGAVLRAENVRALKRNGIVIFLDRPLEKLITTDDRPLSSSKDALVKRYNERIDIYRASADVIVDAGGSIEEVTQAVLKVLE